MRGPEGGDAFDSRLHSRLQEERIVERIKLYLLIFPILSASRRPLAASAAVTRRLQMRDDMTRHGTARHARVVLGYSTLGTQQIAISEPNPLPP